MSVSDVTGLALLLVVVPAFYGGVYFLTYKFGCTERVDQLMAEGKTKEEAEATYNREFEATMSRIDLLRMSSFPYQL